MSPAKTDRPVTDCACGRIGYMLVFCQDHAPIPYTLTQRGIRETRRMRQWDVIFGPLEERRRNGQGEYSTPALKAWATRRAAASKQS